MPWRPILPDDTGKTNLFQCYYCDMRILLGYKTKHCAYVFCPYCGSKMEGDGDNG